jgi:ABC-2 type transport system permease protein
MSAATSAVAAPRSRRPSRSVWWLVFRGEVEELWVAGNALNLLILFTCLMSLTAFLLATNSELSLTPPRLMIVTTIQAAITFGLFIGLVWVEA